MADDTNNLLLPYILASQSQKHVTHNDALRLLDGIVQMTVVRSDLTAPPGSPAEGACYIVATGGTGAWDTWDGDIAMYADGSWFRIVANNGMRTWDLNLGSLLVRSGGVWTSLVAVAVGATYGATTGVAVLEEELAGLSGATVDSSIEIPDRAICLGVSTRTVTDITGATSYDCGIVGETGKFGGTLGISTGANNAGVIGPEAFYADTAIRLTANGSDFTAGAVRIAIHYLTVGGPS